MSDLLVILNWILSMITKEIQLDQNAMFHANDKLIKTNVILNLNDVLNGWQFISSEPATKFLNNSFSESFLDTLNATQEYYLHSELILNYFNREKIVTFTKIINSSGLCQLHYYLTIISLYGTLCYTLACLFDRVFKLKV